MQELEVEAVCVMHKKMQLRAASGALFNGTIDVFECENPFCLIIQITTEQNHSVRMDVFREDLGRELREWLDGSVVRHPAIIISQRIEEAISLFVRFGQTPAQSDLIMWILSRSEIIFGNQPSLTFGSASRRETSHDNETRSHKGQLEKSHSTSSTRSTDNYDRIQIRNDFPLSAAQGNRRSSDSDRNLASRSHSRSQDDSVVTTKSSLETKKIRIKESTGAMFNSVAVDDHLNTASTTKQILGSSVALSALSKHKVKGRSTAAVFDTKSWTSDHFRLVGDLERARKDIQKTMEERRKVIEVSAARQKQASDKYGQIRNKVGDAVSLNTWVNTASNELQTYYRIQEDIDVEVLRQRSRAQRACQKTRWTIAPNGFTNRRGKYEKGPYMGPGPLPPEATTRLRDPRMEATTNHYYWDASGRRHARIEHTGEDGHSTVEFALDAIKRASENISAYKLDLKEVFDHFDIDGNGRISISEMEEVFKHLGVKLDDVSLQAVFKHFDPNGSGWIDYGEFTWAFFNRRSLVRKWQRSVQGMTEDQIEARFHAADINGDNELSFKEFDKLLMSFNVTLSIQERETLFRKFDSDGNGGIQLEEFIKFIHAEQEHLHLSGRKKSSDEINERKWNNSVTYKVDLASIAAQQAKREQARAEKLAKRRAASNSPPPRGERSNSNQEANRMSRPSSAGPASRRPTSRPVSPTSYANAMNTSGNGSTSARRAGSPFNGRPGSPSSGTLRPKSPNPSGTVWGRPTALPQSAQIAAKHKTKSGRTSRSSILIARGIGALSNIDYPGEDGPPPIGRRLTQTTPSPSSQSVPRPLSARGPQVLTLDSALSARGPKLPSEIIAEDGENDDDDDLV